MKRITFIFLSLLLTIPILSSCRTGTTDPSQAVNGCLDLLRPQEEQSASFSLTLSEDNLTRTLSGTVGTDFGNYTLIVDRNGLVRQYSDIVKKSNGTIYINIDSALNLLDENEVVLPDMGKYIGKFMSIPVSDISENTKNTVELFRKGIEGLAVNLSEKCDDTELDKAFSEIQKSYKTTSDTIISELTRLLSSEDHPFDIERIAEKTKWTESRMPSVELLCKAKNTSMSGRSVSRGYEVILQTEDKTYSLTVTQNKESDTYRKCCEVEESRSVNYKDVYNDIAAFYDSIDNDTEETNDAPYRFELSEDVLAVSREEDAFEEKINFCFANGRLESVVAEYKTEDELIHEQIYKCLQNAGFTIKNNRNVDDVTRGHITASNTSLYNYPAGYRQATTPAELLNIFDTKCLPLC